MILLLGSSGYVGSAFQKFLNGRNIPFNTLSIRYTDPEEKLIDFVDANNIEGIINCSGYVGIPNVDECEKHRGECLVANTFLPRRVARVCEDRNIPHVFISSGCIFFDEKCEDGLEPSIEFRYDDKPNFTFDQKYRSWYSGTKAAGEKNLAPFTATSICRLRIPFNSEINSRNFLYKAINYNKLVNSTNSFSNLDEFVESCYKILERDSRGKSANIYNLTQPGWMTTKDVVYLLNKYDLAKDKTFFDNYGEFLFSVIAPRSNCVLKSCSDRLGLNMTPIKESMEQSIREYKDKL